MTEKFLDGKVIVKVGDITEEDADAIVNAANSALTLTTLGDGSAATPAEIENLAHSKKLNISR